MGIFGTSGIRGRYPSDVNEGLMLSVGQTLASLFDLAVVGRDVRTSGTPLQAALMAGLASGGSSVHDCGVVSTPTVAHAAALFDFGGIVTASHNPPEYNGLKLWSPSGLAFDEQQRRLVEEALESGGSHGNWKEVGQVRPYTGALDEHKEKILAAVEGCEARVAVDCGNGATSLLTPYVLEAMGCSVLAIHSQPDGSFPGRGAEPRDEVIGDLKAAVTAGGCQLGVAHDGDGDRMVAVDHEGRLVRAEKLLILFARALKANKVVAPVDTSMVVEDTLEKGKVVRTRVGDVFVAETLMAEKADLGGEASGTWIFPTFALCPDGIFAAAYLCSLLQESSLKDMVADVPDYPLIRGSVDYEGKLPLDRLGEALEAEDVEDVSKLDGWRLDYGDGWGLVRASGTEYKVRITAEARKEDRAREIYANLLSRVSRAIR